MQNKKSAIQPTREENYPEWYQEVVRLSGLAEHAPVRGCMVIKPWGFAVWERVQKELDARIKATGTKNAYFPLFIPLSFLEKEAEHVEGFAKECAVVTHHRLEKNKDGKLVPAGPLEEPLVVRPTSEIIIGEMFAKWITSYRDLPLLINQWCNVVRWEMRPRIFLRTMEFLWQEGHTAHATSEEAHAFARKMHDVYADFMESVIALPAIKGEKTPRERFPGAVATYTLEAMMQDRKALQGCTSHFLGQNFSKACGIRFQTKQGGLDFAWTTSWGFTTRIIGALIMTHSDDDGLILPPRVAPSHAVIIPVIPKEELKAKVLVACHQLAEKLREKQFHGEKLDVIVDEREMGGGEKSWDWIKKGIPLRLEIGPREMEEGRVTVKRRDLPHKESQAMSQSECVAGVHEILEKMQAALYTKARAYRDANIKKIDSYEELKAFFTPKNPDNPEIHGGFASCPYAIDSAAEEKMQHELGVTVRCIPLDAKEEAGTCILTGKPSRQRAIFAKAY